ncbi:MAG: glycosyl hydrolase family 28-related protein [Sandaracinaceae bacterium]
MTRPTSVLLACALTACAPLDVGEARQALTSPLWGMTGEHFVPDGRLMDWSYAGYHAGEDPIPDVAQIVDVTDYGAVGDGTTDDGQAFEDAIAAADTMGGGAVRIPSGRYLLRRRLALPSGVVVRGDGRDQTTLYFPEPLESLYPGASDWSFGGAFLYSSGSSSLPTLTTVTAPASRGDVVIHVASSTELAVGDWIQIRQTDDDGSLIRRLHADFVDGGTDNVGDLAMRFSTRISAIEGDAITLERALPLDLEARWSPTIHAQRPTREEIGIEHLTMEFPVTTYPGHFNELGYNAIQLHATYHSWVRDVTILNTDYGVSFTSSFFCTATGVILDTTGDRGSLVGHHGLNNGHGGDNLFVDFDVRATFVHDLTNEWYAHGVVFTRGTGVDLCLDHHRAAPYSTLWTELDLGAGRRAWTSGGSNDRGPHTAAYDTLWNVTSARTLPLPAADYGPRMTFVGFDTDDTIPAAADDWYLESVAAADLEPSNLWEAMRARRLGAMTPPDAGVLTTDAGEGPADASVHGDAGPGPTDRDGGPSRGSDAGEPDPSSGCACRASIPDRASRAPWLAIFAFAALALRRRTRRS